jgi:hypothetical protein
MAFSRDDVLAIERIEEAFDLFTSGVQVWEVDLIRTALTEGLIEMTLHAVYAADDDGILPDEVWPIIKTGEPVSKDIDPHGPRKIGINFESPLEDGRRICVKVSWENRYYIATRYST